MVSINSVLISLAVAYLCYTGYQFLLIFYPNSCDPTKRPDDCLRPAFPEATRFTLELYGRPTAVPGAKLEFLFSERRVTLQDAFERTFSVPLPVHVAKNASGYEVAAVLFPAEASARSAEAVQASAVVTALRVPGAAARHLLQGQKDSDSSSGSSSSSSSSSDKRPWIHWRSVLTVNVVKGDFVFDRNAFPMELNSIVRLHSRDTYLPILSINQLQFKETDLVKVNSSDRKALLTLRCEPVGVGQLRLWQILDVSISSLKNLGFKDSDIDDVKGIFSDTNFYLLLLTISVSVFHLLFDFLAFKNDIAFWRGVDKNVGISSTAVAWRCFSGFVILLYLAEEKSSLLVTVPAGLQLLIELWKLTKVLKVTVSLSSGFQRAPLTDAERETGALDSQGTKYLAYLLLPLCIGAPVYSLLYVQHKSWYSWTVNSLANCVYAFGFLFMTPQLFINYKLKSVAHLPWKALTYKAFNTFIDDLFAFIIRMPTAHRLACFRDDVVFVIYMYQRWLYPVDRSRTNEFGQSFKEEQEAEQQEKPKVE